MMLFFYFFYYTPLLKWLVDQIKKFQIPKLSMAKDVSPSTFRPMWHVSRVHVHKRDLKLVNCISE